MALRHATTNEMVLALRYLASLTFAKPKPKPLGMGMGMAGMGRSKLAKGLKHRQSSRSLDCLTSLVETVAKHRSRIDDGDGDGDGVLQEFIQELENRRNNLAVSALGMCVYSITKMGMVSPILMDELFHRLYSKLSKASRKQCDGDGDGDGWCRMLPLSLWCSASMQHEMDMDLLEALVSYLPSHMCKRQLVQMHQVRLYQQMIR